MECVPFFLPLQPGSPLLSLSLSLSLRSVFFLLHHLLFHRFYIYDESSGLVVRLFFFPPPSLLPMARVALHDRSPAVVLGRLISL